ncbi:MAG TPA: beta-propeller fold lactonase family protein [Terriglobales bacterium]|nr:beta-propeller fold lactonase family protein [Terriglobales bacterium]
MSFFGAARAAQVCHKGRRRLSAIVAIVAVLSVAGFLLSCGGGKQVPQFGQHQNIYVTLPGQGSVLLMQINTITGEITAVAQTPQVGGTSPLGLAELNKSLYVANSGTNTISQFDIATDGSLAQNTPPTQAGAAPHSVIIDPSGKYLLVTNSLSNDVSVFSIDSSSGALTAVPNSPFPIGAGQSGPAEILIPPSGDLAYVSCPGNGTVTAFTFSPSTGQLAQIQGSPYYSGAGASGLATDNAGTHLYVANATAINNPQTTIGNISGYNINQTQGAGYGTLSPITGSPFTSIAGNNPTVLVYATTGNFLFATTAGSNYSVWAFTIDSQTGRLTPTVNSPFSVVAGNLFAVIDNVGGFFYIGSPTGIQGYTYDQNTGQPTVINKSPFSTNGVSPGRMVISP